MSTQIIPNRLSKEKSPYLLQHANNPVNWFPWGDEAFETAKAENMLDSRLCCGYTCDSTKNKVRENNALAVSGQEECLRFMNQ